jgi:hypothetical protein
VQFETLFGSLAIGQKPTLLRNHYFVMKWDFSLVKAQGETKDIEAALHRHINLCVRRCAGHYQLDVDIREDDAIDSFGALLRGHPAQDLPVRRSPTFWR